VVAFDRSRFKLKLLSAGRFCYLNKIIVSKHGINGGLRHSYHIIHYLTETSVFYILTDNREGGKNGLSVINLSNNTTIPSDI
jgi:hypothetical protein